MGVTCKRKFNLHFHPSKRKLAEKNKNKCVATQVSVDRPATRNDDETLNGPKTMRPSWTVQEKEDLSAFKPRINETVRLEL